MYRAQEINLLEAFNLQCSVFHASKICNIAITFYIAIFNCSFVFIRVSFSQIFPHCWTKCKEEDQCYIPLCYTYLLTNIDALPVRQL